jgi:quinol monooxygenase YgiN
MRIGLVAKHYPRPDCRDEMIARVRQIAEVMRQVPGCLSVDCWTSPDGGTVVTTGQWESESALADGFAAVSAAAVDFDYDERETRPRETLQLVSV